MRKRLLTGLASLALLGATTCPALASYAVGVAYSDYIYPKVIGVNTDQDASNWCKVQGHVGGKINSAGGVTCWQ